MRVIREALRSMVKTALDRFGESTPDLTRAFLRLPDRNSPSRTREFDCYLQLDFAGDQYLRRHVDERSVRMECCPNQELLLTEARRMYAQMAEDRIVQRQMQQASEGLQQMRSFMAPRAWSELAEQFSIARDHVYRFHGIDRASGPDRSVQFQADYTVGFRCDETATEVGIRSEYMRREIARRVREQTERAVAELAQWGASGAFVPPSSLASLLGDVGSPEAQARGMALLKANLTPAQLAQYEQHKHFDVKGGSSGKTYRIHHGRQMNIHELDADGKAVQGICFLPEGGLVAGDCMVAQKTALELFEEDALKIANRFEVRSGPGNPLLQGRMMEYAGITFREDISLPPGVIRFDNVS